MEQSKPLEEIDVWDRPPESGIVQKERNKKFFEQNQTNSLLFNVTQHAMMRRLKMISGSLQEISFIAITWNPESNCTCREKNHFRFGGSTSTSPEQHIRHWMYCWRKLLKITGTWMEKENYQMHGQVSQDLFYWTKSHLKDTHGPGGDQRESKGPPGQTLCSRCPMHQNEKRCKSGESRNQISIMPYNCGVSTSLNQMMMIFFKNTMKNARRKLQIPMSAAMPCKTPVNCRGQQYCETQDQICLYCRCRRIYENTFGRNTATVSWTSHRCKRNEFTESL